MATQLTFGFDLEKQIKANVDSTKLFNSLYNPNSLKKLKRLPTQEEVELMESEHLKILEKYLIGTDLHNTVKDKYNIKSLENVDGKIENYHKDIIFDYFEKGTKEVAVLKYSRETKIIAESNDTFELRMLLPENLANIKLGAKFNIRSSESICQCFEIDDIKKQNLSTLVYCDTISISEPVRPDTLIPDRNLVYVNMLFKKHVKRITRKILENATGLETILDESTFKCAEHLSDLCLTKGLKLELVSTNEYKTVLGVNPGHFLEAYHDNSEVTKVPILKKDVREDLWEIYNSLKKVIYDTDALSLIDGIHCELDMSCSDCLGTGYFILKSVNKEKIPVEIK